MCEVMLIWLILGSYKLKVKVVTVQVLCKMSNLKHRQKACKTFVVFLPLNTKDKRTNIRTKPLRHEENTSRGQIGN